MVTNYSTPQLLAIGNKKPAGKTENRKHLLNLRTLHHQIKFNPTKLLHLPIHTMLTLEKTLPRSRHDHRRSHTHHQNYWNLTQSNDHVKSQKKFVSTIVSIKTTLDHLTENELNDECTAALDEFNQSNAHTRKRKCNDDPNETNNDN
jgi:hypothetical protein